ncbi:MAG: T9SS type A sorting domain-containing protein [Flavobacteriales bacterium]
MKTLSILFVLLIINIGLLSQFVISPSISVTMEGEDYGFRSPKVISYGENNDEVMVFWSRTGSEQAMFVSVLSDGVFAAPTPVPTGNAEPNLWSGNLGPGIASFGNHIYITFEVYGSAIYCVHSADGGGSWDEPVAAFTPPAGRFSTIPNIAVDASGNVYVAYVNTNSAEEDAHYGLVKSTNQGESFTDEVIVSAGVLSDEVCECCNGNIEVGLDNEIYVGFRNNSDNLRDCWLVKSSDLGASFEEIYDVDDSDWILNGCPSNGPDFTLNEGEVVTVFYTGADNFDGDIYFTLLDTASGVVSSAESILLSNEGAIGQNSARIASNSQGEIMVVFQESFQFSQNVGFALAQNGSELGQQSYVLNDSSGSQKQPDVMAIGNVFHVVYEDSSLETVVYQSVSSDPNLVLEEERGAFLLYPNPAEHLIHIKGSTTLVNYEIISPLGRSVLKEYLSNERRLGQASVDISSLHSGVYFLSVNDSAFKKFVKE